MTYDIKCKHCGRFLGKTEVSTKVEIKCSNSACKKLETYDIVFLTDLIKEPHHG